MPNYSLCSHFHQWVNMKKKFTILRMELNSEQLLVFRMKEIHPIHVENTTVNYEGWIQLNFTTILTDWIRTKRPNNMLDITIQCENAKGQMETPSIDANYLLSLWDAQRQPFITAYFKNDESNGNIFSSKNKVRLRYECNDIRCLMHII